MQKLPFVPARRRSGPPRSTAGTFGAIRSGSPRRSAHGKGRGSGAALL